MAVNKLGHEIAVVLGGGFAKDGNVGESTILRAEAGVELAKTLPDATIILSGGRCPAEIDITGISEAEAMARVFDRANISRDRLLLEGESRCTLGNAVLVTARYLQNVQPRRLYVVTSPFHVERALVTFRGVLGPKWDFVPVESAVAHDDVARGATEHGGVAWAHRFFTTVAAGNLPAIIRRMVEEKPIYQPLEWLRSETLQQVA